MANLALGEDIFLPVDKSRDGPEQAERDALFLSQLNDTVRADFPSRWTDPIVQKFLFGYDAMEEAQRALKLQMSTTHL